MAKYTVIFEGDVTASCSTTLSDEDAARLFAYGQRQFNTDNPTEVLMGFATISMGNMMGGMITNEQQIAAQAASDAIPPVNYEIVPENQGKP